MTDAFRPTPTPLQGPAVRGALARGRQWGGRQSARRPTPAYRYFTTVIRSAAGGVIGLAAVEFAAR